MIETTAGREMGFDPDIHHRHSIRLKGYDYTENGAYFVTICTQNRELLLEGNGIKNMITAVWDKLPYKFPLVDTDEFIIMPNHIHGIIVITTDHVGADPRVCPSETTHIGVDLCVYPDKTHRKKKGEHMGSPLQKPSTLGEIVQWFKTITTNRYIHGVKNNGWKPFPGKFWQRNYYEHIIRNENELTRIREYIRNNPLQWQFDRENPNRLCDAAYESAWRWLEG